MKLTELQNGSWVDLASVTSICVSKAEWLNDTNICGPRVQVNHKNGAETIQAVDEQQARQIAAELAAKVNEASPQNAVILPPLEERCGLCHGNKGFSDASVRDGWEACGRCGGSGFTPTESGKAILALLRHNFTVKAELAAIAS